MSASETSLTSVLERFPDRKDTLKQLFREKRSFQTLCEDRRRCAEALKYWCRSDAEEAEERKNEYSELLLDLEIEIVQNITEFNA